MYFLLPYLNLSLATAGLVLWAVSILLFVDLFVWQGNKFSDTMKRFAWPVVLVTTILSVVISLLYSEYFLFVPCSLCWLQRIAIYPQSIMSVLAFRLRDNVSFPIYGIGLSLFGLGVAIYQYIYQMLPKGTPVADLAPCLLDGSNADCAEKVIDQFGFVTFPFISAATFVFLIAVYIYMRRSNIVNNKE